MTRGNRLRKPKLFEKGHGSCGVEDQSGLIWQLQAISMIFAQLALGVTKAPKPVLRASYLKLSCKSLLLHLSGHTGFLSVAFPSRPRTAQANFSELNVTP